MEELLGNVNIIRNNRYLGRRQFVAKTLPAQSESKTRNLQSNVRAPFLRLYRRFSSATVKIFHIFLLGINPARNTRWPACSPLKILLTNNPLGCIRIPGLLKGVASLLCVCVRFSRTYASTRWTVARRLAEQRKRGEIRRNGQRVTLHPLDDPLVQPFTRARARVHFYRENGIPQVCPE